jgi:hypothetical protein
MTGWILDVCDLMKVSSGTIVGVWRMLGVMNVNRGEEEIGMAHIFPEAGE